MTKRSQKTKQYKFEIHCINAKPILKILQGYVVIYEVPSVSSKYKEIARYSFDVSEGSSGFEMRGKQGISREFLEVIKNIITAYYRGMILQDVVHTWYTVPLVRSKLQKYQPDVV